MPIKGNILVCPNCNRDQAQINFVKCEYCGFDLGAPNVNVVSTEIELKALQQRYEEATKYASNNGTEHQLNKFHEFFTKNVNAIINLKLPVLREWIINNSAYKSYHRSVEEGNRFIAAIKDDQKRSVIDGVFHGSYGKDIIYAALTLNGKGLISYGECGVIIDENAVRLRASILEENSFTFIKAHNLNFENFEIPIGFRSSWENKIKIAIAKLYKKITLDDENDFCRFLLFSAGNRQTDNFIEVHIYKEITTLAIKHIYLPKPKNKKDELFVKLIEKKCSGKVSIT